MPKISVIMPVYNTRIDYLREAVESILNQTYKDFEFIIVDDGSTDSNIKNVILSYSDDRIKYFYKENGGVGQALNYGIERAQGEYIARMDSDDISFPNRFEKQVEFLDKNSDISLVGAWFNIVPNGGIAKHPEEVTYLRMYNYCCVGHPTVMFKKADFDKYNLKYDENYKCEDYELWSRAIRFLKFRNIQEVLLNYRWYETNASALTSDFAESVQKVQQNMLDFLTDDIDLQKRMHELIFPPQIEEKDKLKFYQKIFSVRNEGRKKILRILGIKISFKRKMKYKDLSGNKRKAASKVVKIMGGLGNQMFEYAFGKALENGKNKTFYDISFFNSCNASSPVAKRVLELNHFNLSLNLAEHEEIEDLKKNTVVENPSNIYNPNYLKPKKALFEGYFQTEKYFKNIRKQLLADFSLKEPLNTKNLQMLEEIKNQKNPVSLHVRRGDYVNLSDIHFLCGIQYYQKAVDFITSKVENPHFYIFSDDTKYVKENLKISCPYTVVDINSTDEGYFDLELMKNCKHNIIANSSFSWWGAWLNQNPDKIVVAPLKWHKDNQNKEWDIFPEEWVLISD